MEPIIVNKEKMRLVGFSFYGDPFSLSAGWTEENEIGRLWQRFMKYLSRHMDHITSIKNSQAMVELHIWDEESAEKGHFEVFVGLEVESLENVPVDLLVKILPATSYAVFTLRGEQITSDWSAEIDLWLSESNYQYAHKYQIQAYDERFKGLDKIKQSVLDIYVPVEVISPGTD